MLKIEFSTDNAAFEDAQGEEVARILTDIADKVQTVAFPAGSHDAPIYDLNGNRIGHCSVTFPKPY